MTSVISLRLSHSEATRRAALGPGLVPGSGLLLTDLYELNMVQAYLDAGMTDTAVFEFFVRKLPRSRG